MFSRLPLTALVVLVLLAIAFLLHDSDEDAILSQLERLREQAAITEPESGIEQLARANSIADGFSESTVFDLSSAGYGPITTEIQSASPFYYAEDYHQQYLAKNPGGYCGLGGTGVCASA